MRKDADFLALFEPYGNVKSAKLLPAVPDASILGEIGFVTFDSKEDAQRAMDALNTSGPRGRDKRILIVDWALISKKKKTKLNVF
jgi:RNA recognition motif-containing protein